MSNCVPTVTSLTVTLPVVGETQTVTLPAPTGRDGAGQSEAVLDMNVLPMADSCNRSAAIDAP